MSIDVSNITVFTQNSICIKERGEAARIIYVDTFQMKDKPHDADFLLITHAHYDHFSPEDAIKVMKDDTIVVVPDSLYVQAQNELPPCTLISMNAGDSISYPDFTIEAIPAYNVLEERQGFHPKSNNWISYVITLDSIRYYLAGDTDQNPDNETVECDVALIPIGGTYTCDPLEAAKFVNTIKPKVVIPTHYGTLAGEKTNIEPFEAHVEEGIKVVRKLWV